MQVPQTAAESPTAASAPPHRTRAARRFSHFLAWYCTGVAALRFDGARRRIVPGDRAFVVVAVSVAVHAVVT